MRTKVHNLFQKEATKSLLIMKLRGMTLAVKFIMNLFIARFMGFEELGLYGLVTVACIMVSPFLGLGLMTIASRKAVTQDPEEITVSLYCYSRFIVLVYAAILTGSIAVGLVLDKPYLTVLIVMVMFLEHVNTDIYGILLNVSRPFLANILHFIRSGAWMLVFMGLAFFVPALRTTEAILIGWVIGSAFALIGFIWAVRNWPWKSAHPRMALGAWVVQTFRESRMIYASGLVETSATYLNHFLVTFFLGLEMTGVYVYFVQIPSALSNLLNSGIIQIARPRLVRAYKNHDPAFLSIYKGCLKHTALIALAAAIFAIPALYFITVYVVDKPLALQWFPVFCAIMTTFVLAMSVQANNLVFYSQHQDILTMKVNTIGLLGGLVLNLLLLPFFALWGAAASSILLNILLLVLQWSYLKPLIVLNK